MAFPLDFLLPRACRGDLFECFLQRVRLLFFWDYFFLACSHFRQAILRFKIPRYCLAFTQTHFPALADEAIFTCPKSLVSTCSEISGFFVMFECFCCCLLVARYFRCIKTTCSHTAHCSLLTTLLCSVHTAAHTAHHATKWLDKNLQKIQTQLLLQFQSSKWTWRKLRWTTCRIEWWLPN